MLDKETIDWFFNGYIDQADRDDWRFAPGNAPDHSGLAPAWIGLAECDPLVDEGVMYADKLRLAGVPVAAVVAMPVRLVSPSPMRKRSPILMSRRAASASSANSPNTPSDLAVKALNSAAGSVFSRPRIG